MLQGGGWWIPVGEKKKKERRVYLASARHKAAPVERKGGLGRQTGSTNKGGKAFQEGSRLLESSLSSRKEAMRGNKAAVKHTHGLPCTSSNKRGCSINPPVIKSQGGERDDKHRWGGWEEADGWAETSTRVGGASKVPAGGENPGACFLHGLLFLRLFASSRLLGYFFFSPLTPPFKLLQIHQATPPPSTPLTPAKLAGLFFFIPIGTDGSWLLLAAEEVQPCVPDHGPTRRTVAPPPPPSFCANAQSAAFFVS